MWKLLIPIIAVALMVLATLSSDAGSRPADFSFINRGDINTLDPQRMSWMQDLRIARCLFEPLVRNDVFSHGFDVVPGVAERWTVSDDGRVYTFSLRDDARWSNGDPVLASDFVYAWRRALLPDVGSDYINFFFAIRGAEAFYRWRSDALALFGAHPFESERASDLLAAVELVGDRLDPAARAQLEAAFPSFATETPADGLTDPAVALRIGSLTLLREMLPAPAPDAEALWVQTVERFDETVGIRAVGDGRTLVVELHEPVSFFLDLVGFAVLAPVHEASVAPYERRLPATGRLNARSAWTKAGRLVSNGPFMLKRWRFKRDMRLEKNPYYWDRASVAIDSMAIPSVEDPNAQVLAYDTGAVDWVSDVTPSYRGDMLRAKAQFYEEHATEVERLRALGLDPIELDRRLPPDPRKNIHALPAFGTYFYNFNCMEMLPDGRANPFADARIRRAFAMTIDKERIVRDVRRLSERVARTLIPPGSIGGYRSPEGVPFDPVAARALLAEAGYPNGEGFITVEILFNKSGGHDLIGQAIAKDWEEHLGVSVSIQQKEIKVFRNDLKKHDFMTSRAGWFGDYGDPTTFLDINKTGDGNNDRKFSHPPYDALLDAAAIERDPAARMRLLERAEAMIVDEALPLIPIFHYSQIYLFDPHKVTGISAHPRQQQDLYRVDILGDGKGADEPRFMPARPGRSETPGGDA